ncbi:unnamed protein product [Phytophthora fragariaefolia]|uniref:Unnamed protein product n=1 Tax=Phytophthora fragariaefolia TaxID=1490495 RepID=A0A9W6WMY4_9STRA|nr:unnamed protein product [Phytophthora fragariaefolia]
MRLHLDDGGNDDDNNQQEVEVSSSVRVAATGDDDQDYDSSTDEEDEGRGEDAREKIVLIEYRRRGKFMVSPPARATVPPPAVPVPATSIRNSKRKKLMIDDFHGRTDESVEAWLATVPQEVRGNWHSTVVHGRRGNSSTASPLTLKTQRASGSRGLARRSGRMTEHWNSLQRGSEGIMDDVKILDRYKKD